MIAFNINRIMIEKLPLSIHNSVFLVNINKK